jgi:glutathione S-transferase
MKGLDAELRDPRVDASHLPDLRRYNPLRTVPTLVDGDRVLTDSLAIAEYLEERAPSPSIWPRHDKSEALEFVRLADRAIDVLVDLGMRYHAVHDHPGFAAVKGELLGRAQGALDRLATKVEARAAAEALVGDAWSIADIATVTLGVWLDGLPARALSFAPAKQIAELGWTVPKALADWTKTRRARPDVAALG